MAKRILSLFRNLFRKRDIEQALDDELRSTLDVLTQEKIQQGLSQATARREALIEIGGIEQVKEGVRAVRAGSYVEDLVRDLRFALRQLRKNPGFAITSILILALGIGASVAIFAFVDAALIEPLPYPEPTRLIAVNESTDLFPRNNLSYPDYVDWKRMNTVFSTMEVFTGTGYALGTPTGSERLQGERVSAGFFQTLGIQPMLGRDFHAGEDVAGAAPVALLSYRTWQQRFGGKADVVGQVVNLSGVAHNRRRPPE